MKNLTGLKDVELLKKEKSAKITTYILLALLIIALVFSLNNYMENGFSNTTIMPVFVLALLVTNFTSLRAIKKEKEIRDIK